jgi:hypothetical protein
MGELSSTIHQGCQLSINWTNGFTYRSRNLRRQPPRSINDCVEDFAPAEGGEVVGNIWVNSTGVAKSVRPEQTRGPTTPAHPGQSSRRAGHFTGPGVEKGMAILIVRAHISS